MPETRKRRRKKDAQSPDMQEKVLSELASVAFSELPDVKLSDKMKALELLGKEIGLFSGKEKEKENASASCVKIEVDYGIDSGTDE